MLFKRTSIYRKNVPFLCLNRGHFNFSAKENTKRDDIYNVS